jgi:glycosyltransferase involved in cell wall biosynthesis
MRFDSLEVICLREGAHALPENVHVHSLGKERGGGGTLRYALRFYRLVWKLRRSYDAVFVHMNPEYALLAGDIWMWTGKKVGLWYNHEVGSFALRMVAPFVSFLFHTSPYAYTARYTKARRMPAGIDTTLFAPKGTTEPPHSVYFQGRIAPAKRVHVLLAALRKLEAEVPDLSATIVGPVEPSYGARLHQEFDELLDGDGVTMKGPVKNEETPALYSRHAVSVNLAADGNFDKSVLESMACETPVIVGSRAFEGLVPDEWRVNGEDSSALTDALSRMFSLSEEERHALGRAERAKVIETQSLPALADALRAAYA